MHFFPTRCLVTSHSLKSAMMGVFILPYIEISKHHKARLLATLPQRTLIFNIYYLLMWVSCFLLENWAGTTFHQLTSQFQRKWSEETQRENPAKLSSVCRSNQLIRSDRQGFEERNPRKPPESVCSTVKRIRNKNSRMRTKSKHVK